METTFGGVNFTYLIAIYGALLLSVDDGLTIPEEILFMSNEEKSYAFTIDSLMAAAGNNRRSWNYYSPGDRWDLSFDIDVLLWVSKNGLQCGDFGVFI